MKKKRIQRTIPFDTTKTLEQLENAVWDEPEGFVTGLILNCHRLRKIPVKDFSVENLRMMIGQHIGLKFLMLPALEVLTINPLAEGDFFEGDLLCSMLSVSPAFRETCSHWQHDLSPIIVRAKELIEQKITGATEEWRWDYKPVLEAIERYEANQASPA